MTQARMPVLLLLFLFVYYRRNARRNARMKRVIMPLMILGAYLFPKVFYQLSLR